MRQSASSNFLSLSQRESPMTGRKGSKISASPGRAVYRYQKRKKDNGDSIMTAMRLAKFLSIAKKLQHLSLAYNKIGDTGLTVLAKSLVGIDCQLKHLDLTQTGMTMSSFRIFIDKVKNNHQLKKLILDHNNLYFGNRIKELERFSV